MKNKINVLKLRMETRESNIENIPSFCLDNYGDCTTETLMTLDNTQENRDHIKSDVLPKYENTIDDYGRLRVVTAYVMEYFEADEDGEFVSGSDFDW